MTSFDYAVLGFAESDIVVEAVEFAIFTSTSRNGSLKLGGYVLRGWMSLNQISSTDIDNIAGFLEDFQSFSDGAAEGSLQYFWEGILSLGVGPMRTISTGRYEGAAIEFTKLGTVGITEMEDEAFSAALLQLKGSLPLVPTLL